MLYDPGHVGALHVMSTFSQNSALFRPHRFHLEHLYFTKKEEIQVPKKPTHTA